MTYPEARRWPGWLLLLLPLTGCATGVSFERELEGSDPVDLGPPCLFSRPIRLGVISPDGRFPALQERVMEQLQVETRSTAVVPPSSRGSTPEDGEYGVRLEFQIESSGKAVNLVSCFPGFLISMPRWYRLRWSFDVTTRIELLRGGIRVAECSRLDRYVMAHTSDAYGLFVNQGWLTVVFSPFLVGPLTSGIVAVFDTPDLERHQWDFARSPQGEQHARAVAYAVASLIAADRSGQGSHDVTTRARHGGRRVPGDVGPGTLLQAGKPRSE